MCAFKNVFISLNFVLHSLVQFNVHLLQLCSYPSTHGINVTILLSLGEVPNFTECLAVHNLSALSLSEHMFISIVPLTFNSQFS